MEGPGELTTGDYDGGRSTTYEIDEGTRLATLVWQEPAGANVYRVYNPNAGTHLFTASLDEARSAAEAGWRWEGVAWVSPLEGAPVHRLYSGASGLHMLTTSDDERCALVAAGWADEGSPIMSGGGTPVYRLYNEPAGDRTFTASQAERDSLVSAGWADEGEAFECAGTGALPIDGFWLMTDAWGELDRYWVDSDGSIAKGRIIAASEGAGWDAYATDDGDVVRGREQVGDYVLIADDDGRLLLGSYDAGWLVTDELDGGLQRYRLESGVLGGTTAARAGEFEVDGVTYVGRYDTGYVIRGKHAQGGYLYECDNDGRLVSKTAENWWEAGGYSPDVHNAAALAKLAVRVVVTCEPADRLTAPGGNLWATCDDARAQEYFKVCEKSTVRWGWGNGYNGSGDHHENAAYASCTQAVAMIARATVDPDMWMIDPGDLRTYCANSNKWDEAGRFSGHSADWLEPGDVLCDTGDDHTALWVGNDLVRMKYPDSTANVYEAHSSFASYPELRTGTMGSYDYVVYRFNGIMGGCDLPYFNPWKLLAGDDDWDNQ